MDDIGSIFFHLCRGVFYISTRTPPAGRESYQFNFLFLIQGKSPFSITHGSQTLPACASMITVTNDDTDLLHFHASLYDYSGHYLWQWQPFREGGVPGINPLRPIRYPCFFAR
jgi:hypothetical protein